MPGGWVNNYERLSRIVAGYVAGAACVILAVAALMGAAFPVVLLVAPCYALILAFVVVLPVFLLLDGLGQLRSWRSALLGSALTVFVAWLTILGIAYTEYEFLFLRRDFQHQLQPDWLLIGLAVLGGCGRRDRLARGIWSAASAPAGLVAFG